VLLIPLYPGLIIGLWFNKRYKISKLDVGIYILIWWGYGVSCILLPSALGYFLYGYFLNRLLFSIIVGLLIGIWTVLVLLSSKSLLIKNDKLQENIYEVG
jgi:hypothetical protein